MKQKCKLVKQEKHKDFEVIQCPKTEQSRSKLDPGCYVLIRVYRKSKEIGAAVCNYKHEILKEFRGTSAKDIYKKIFDYEKQHKKKWFTYKSHIAYLGEELGKAEMSLKLRKRYVQD